MKWREGSDYYYFIYYPKEREFGLAKVKLLHLSKYYKDAGQDDELFPAMRIEKLYNKTYMGHERRIKEGAEISANELQGVGASGPDEYFFKTNKDLFDKIFKINR
jgi:hypothetical protein